MGPAYASSQEGAFRCGEESCEQSGFGGGGSRGESQPHAYTSMHESVPALLTVVEVTPASGDEATCSSGQLDGLAGLLFTPTPVEAPTPAAVPAGRVVPTPVAVLTESSPAPDSVPTDTPQDPAGVFMSTPEEWDNAATEWAAQEEVGAWDSASQAGNMGVVDQSLRLTGPAKAPHVVKTRGAAAHASGPGGLLAASLQRHGPMV